MAKIGDIIYFEGDKQRYLITHFDGPFASTRRFIKSRNDWAKVSTAWFRTDEIDDPERPEGYRFINKGPNG